MTFLLDTHAAYWWWQDSPRLPKEVSNSLRDHEVFVSAVTAYELSAKHTLGKLPEAADVVASFHEYLERSGFIGLAVTIEHARVAGLLPGPHRDPFDRLLIAQAKVEKATMISADPVFKRYRVPTLW